MKRLWQEFLTRVERLELTLENRKRCFANVRDVIETTGSSTIDDNAEHAFLTTTRYASYIYVAMCERVIEITKDIYCNGERWALPTMVSRLERVSAARKERTMLRLSGAIDRGIEHLTVYAIETIGPCFKPLVEEIVSTEVAALNKKKSKKATIIEEKVYYLRKLLDATGLKYVASKESFDVSFGRTAIRVIASGKSLSYGIIDGVSAFRLSLDEFDRYAAFIETGMAAAWQTPDAPRLSRLRRTNKPTRRSSSSRIDVTRSKLRGSTSSSSSERSPIVDASPKQ